MTPDLTARAACVAADIDRAKNDLRKALIEGGTTVAIRGRLNELEREQAAIAAAQAQVEAERNQAKADDIERTARTIAETVLTELGDRLAALRPPSWPLPA